MTKTKSQYSGITKGRAQELFAQLRATLGTSPNQEGVRAVRPQAVANGAKWGTASARTSAATYDDFGVA